MKHLIIGASAAGLAAAEAILEADPAAAVTLLGEERHPPYSRPLISYLLARQVPEERLALPSRALSRLQLRTDARAVALDPHRKTVRLASGEVVSYDRLLLATGAASKPLGLAGEDAPNVFGLRTRDDAAAIDGELAAGAQAAVVLGGGLVGVKAAQALAARGLRCHLCVSSPFPLSRNIDPEAGELVTAALQAEGVRVHLGYRPVGLEVADGRVTAVAFAAPAERLACDLVIRGKGVEPRTELLEGLGVPVTDGVTTDATLRTPLPDVWAAGDVARTRDVISGDPAPHALWPMAVEQGTLAGRNMAGAGLEYPGSLGMNTVHLGDRFVVSAGLTNPPNGACRVHTRRDPVRGAYRRVVERDGTLVGVVAVGHPDQAGVLTAAVRRGARTGELPFDPLDSRLHWGRYAFAEAGGGRGSS